MTDHPVRSRAVSLLLYVARLGVAWQSAPFFQDTTPNAGEPVSVASHQASVRRGHHKTSVINKPTMVSLRSDSFRHPILSKYIPVTPSCTRCSRHTASSNPNNHKLQNSPARWGGGGGWGAFSASHPMPRSKTRAYVAPFSPALLLRPPLLPAVERPPPPNQPHQILERK